MTNNNQVNWGEIPEDVEAVIFNLSGDVVQHLKTIDGSLYFKVIGLMDHYIPSGQYESLSDREENIGDFLGGAILLRRPSPITQPTPEPPESTQVESTEVEDTTTPEFDWSSVDEDVEAVIAKEGNIIQQLTSINGILYHKGEMFGKERWIRGHYRTLAATEKYLHLLGCGKWKLIRRPPATTPTNDIGLNAGYDIYKEAAINFKPDADMYDIFKGADSKPSILTILQEAQQSILKYHGVTGKVKFTVLCSE